MNYVDLTRAAFSELQVSISPNSAAVNHAEAHCLRAKILGLLIRQSRLAAQRGIEDCARYLNLTPKMIEAWELGRHAPSLPQLEGLNRCFNTPMPAESSNAATLPPAEQAEYTRVRQRLLGALLQSARQAQAATLQDISAKTGLDTNLLQRYEYGETAMPVHHLTALAQAVQRDISYFTDAPESALRPASPSDRKLPPPADSPDNNEAAHLAQFAADQNNRAFIRLAMAFRHIDLEDLDRIAAALYAIIQEKRGDNGPLPT